MRMFLLTDKALQYLDACFRPKKRRVIAIEKSCFGSASVALKNPVRRFEDKQNDCASQQVPS